MKKVLIGFPVGVSVHTAFTKSLLDLQRFELQNPSPDYEILSIEYSSSLYVEENRNKLVDLAKESNADWLLMLDSDESFQPTLLRQLMKTAHETERPIVFGLYSNIMQAPAQVQGGYYHIDMVFREMPDGQYFAITPPSDTRPFFVDAAGTGVLLTHMSVYDKIEYPWFTLDYIVPTGKTRPQVMNEDISFCRKARVAGFNLLCDPMAEVVHHKNIALLPSAFRRFMERAQEAQAEMSKAG